MIEASADIKKIERKFLPKDLAVITGKPLNLILKSFWKEKLLQYKSLKNG